MQKETKEWLQNSYTDQERALIDMIVTDLVVQENELRKAIGTPEEPVKKEKVKKTINLLNRAFNHEPVEYIGMTPLS